MSDVENRRVKFVASCLNNLYGCITTHFTKFLIMIKQQKRNKRIHKTISLTILKLDKLAHSGIILRRSESL